MLVLNINGHYFMANYEFSICLAIKRRLGAKTRNFIEIYMTNDRNFICDLLVFGLQFIRYLIVHLFKKAVG
jgi:hypothetical protein